MKNIRLYIFLFLIFLISSLYIYIKSVVDSIKFDLNLNNLNLIDLSSESIKKGTTNINIKLEFIVKFISLFNISFSDLNIKAYYKNNLIANSLRNEENLKKITLISDINNKIYHTFNVIINKDTIDLITKIKDKKYYLIDYELSFKILSLTIKYKNKYQSHE